MPCPLNQTPERCRIPLCLMVPAGNSTMPPPTTLEAISAMALLMAAVLRAALAHRLAPYLRALTVCPPSKDRILVCSADERAEPLSGPFIPMFTLVVPADNEHVEGLGVVG